VCTGVDGPWRSLSPADAGYPRLLKEIRAAPGIEVAGVLDADAEMVAVVGSRRCSTYGEDLAYQLGAELAGAGLVVVSGLARGIDGAAHRGALDAGGLTVAVMGTGRDTIYPHQHNALARRIAGQGALVTQFPLETVARPENFPQRNATISGMSLGVVVVEARRRSGAMLTAGAAGIQGRVVMAVPGSIHNPNSRGCHDLVRDGARLVTGAEEVIQELRNDPLFHLLRPAGPDPGPRRYGDARDAILELLSGRFMTLEEVADRLRLTAREAATALATLRLDGAVEVRDGVYQGRRRAGPGV
jgi:DNA processing protein